MEMGPFPATTASAAALPLSKNLCRAAAMGINAPRYWIVPVVVIDRGLLPAATMPALVKAPVLGLMV